MLTGRDSLPEKEAAVGLKAAWSSSYETDWPSLKSLNRRFTPA